TSASATPDNAIGAVLSDSVTVSGGFDPTGTVTFTLDQPDNTTITVGSVAINGDATYALPTTVTATQLGTYTWHASYSGDSFNNGAVDDGQNESLTIVKASPTVSTQASVTLGAGSDVLDDSATISGGFNVSGGSITFTLDEPGGTTITVGTVTVTGTG